MIYDRIYKALKSHKEQNQIIFLTGPKTCGKTTCLKQLEDHFDEAVYTDIKQLYLKGRTISDYYGIGETRRFMLQVIDDIENSRNVIHLIDDFTYCYRPDTQIEELSMAFSDYPDTKTRVVITGNPPQVLSSWAHLSFGRCARYISCDFFSYPEWLYYKGNSIVSAQTYRDFLNDTDSFYHDFKDPGAYLQACIDESVVTEYRAAEVIYNNDRDYINVEILKDILYVSMFNHWIIKDGTLDTALLYRFAKTDLKIDDAPFIEKMISLLQAHLSSFERLRHVQVSEALQLLYYYGLVSATLITDDFLTKADLHDLFFDETRFHFDPPDIDPVKDLNIRIRQPFLFIALLKDLLKEHMPSQLPPSLINRIAEGHALGLLISRSGFQYRGKDGKGIDYVDNARHLAVSFLKDADFDLLPGDFKKIQITQGEKGIVNGIRYLPYERFVFKHSERKE
jgi:hypothetical protein